MLGSFVVAGVRRCSQRLKTKNIAMANATALPTVIEISWAKTHSIVALPSLPVVLCQQSALDALPTGQYPYMTIRNNM